MFQLLGTVHGFEANTFGRRLVDEGLAVGRVEVEHLNSLNRSQHDRGSALRLRSFIASVLHTWHFTPKHFTRDLWSEQNEATIMTLSNGKVAEVARLWHRVSHAPKQRLLLQEFFGPPCPAFGPFQVQMLRTGMVVQSTSLQQSGQRMFPWQSLTWRGMEGQDTPHVHSSPLQIPRMFTMS